MGAARAGLDRVQAARARQLQRAVNKAADPILVAFKPIDRLLVARMAAAFPGAPPVAVADVTGFLDYLRSTPPQFARAAIRTVFTGWTAPGRMNEANAQLCFRLQRAAQHRPLHGM